MEYTVILEKLTELNGVCWVNSGVVVILIAVVLGLGKMIYTMSKTVLNLFGIIQELKAKNKDQTDEISTLKRNIYKLESKIDELIDKNGTK